MSVPAWIWLSDLRLPWARVGVHAHEHNVDQPLVLQLGLAVDVAAAITTDDVTQAVNWSAVEAHVVGHLRRQHYKLIETFAYTLARSLLDSFALVACVDLRVEKTGCLKHGTGAVHLTLQR
ncbi:MAG: dihydroneopterin aldolase [Deltaproteobacteria bacterium]|nr:MAG: dihydroneopterin aldolase [Deltaproteobacteria bacterium]